ncbi:MAG: hypothetical protein SFU98_08750 [Leptospiraceae bacterium]|nr:hypothetical protein [Leptospiraceae bacterium]
MFFFQLLIIFFFVILPIFSENITNDLLIKNEFMTSNLDKDSNGAQIKFFLGNRYKLYYDAPGASYFNEGIYKIIKEKIIISPTICKWQDNSKENIPCDISFGKGNCQLIDILSPTYRYYLFCKSDKHLDYFYYLVRDHIPALTKKKYSEEYNRYDSFAFSKEFLFPLKKSSVKKNIIRFFSRIQTGFKPLDPQPDTINIPVLTLGYKNAHVTNNETYMYALPDNESSKSLYYINKTDPGNGFLPYGTKITLIARTLSVRKIDEKNFDYWYLINVGETKEVWISGNNISFKNP